VISNILFISIHLLPFHFFYQKSCQWFLKLLFNFVNIPLLLLNCIDWGLFKFTGRRTGAEIFSIMSFGEDLKNTLPKMIIDYWYMLLIFFLLVFLMNRFYPRIKFHEKRIPVRHKSRFKKAVWSSMLFLLFSGFTLIGFRGGVQFKPLNILSASRYGAGKNTALVLNTSFTVIKSFGKQRISEMHWMPTSVSKRINPVIKLPQQGITFKHKNVVVIILESFGKEYIGRLNSNDGYTPFLDSLMSYCLVFDNAFANGKRSIDGIPAVVAGIPALLPDPFITSAYSSDNVTSIPSLLKPKGYTSVFFHGGTNGTMGFDNFSRLAGFDYYFGRKEYNNDDDFDGSWGIFDEPFLQRAILEMNKLNTPFISTIFTISSHHPYRIPDKYSNIFAEGSLPIHRSIRYADYSLKKFFEAASKTQWYSNTLFVITADHTAEPEKPFYQGQVGLYSIPILYFSPGDSLLKGISSVTTQQIDILPFVMDYLGYDSSYFAFGNRIFDKRTDGFAVSSIDYTYQLISNDYAYEMKNQGKYSFYNFKNDSTLKIDISGTDTVLENKMELKLKAFVQNFNHAIITNQMK
jgi:phosphoglycerol transferase MdoB-like AlkP superfamily enzyme